MIALVFTEDVEDKLQRLWTVNTITVTLTAVGVGGAISVWPSNAFSSMNKSVFEFLSIFHWTLFPWVRCVRKEMKHMYIYIYIYIYIVDRCYGGRGGGFSYVHILHGTYDAAVGTNRCRTIESAWCFLVAWYMYIWLETICNHHKASGGRYQPNRPMTQW